MKSPIEILTRACALVADDDIISAAGVITESYPFVPSQPRRKAIKAAHATGIFFRDGFRCRYSGEQLVFPGALRLLHVLMPDAIPYQVNWKVAETDPAFWQLSAIVDHVVPVARGGPEDDDDNLVTTSMLRNSAKAHWLLEELGWSLCPIAPEPYWDGLLG